MVWLYRTVHKKATIFTKDFDISNCIISSVVEELTDTVKNAIENIFGFKPLILNTNLKINITINSDKPETCGADRIANAVSASTLYKQRPVIVVDSGSATTFDIIDKNNTFIGGLIMPGIDMQLNSLSEKTSKLPKLNVKMVKNKLNIIANDTNNSIFSGVVIAHAMAVQGLLNGCEQELGSKAFVIGTGGNANLINEYMNERKFDVINPTLTLDGLNEIYKLNV